MEPYKIIGMREQYKNEFIELLNSGNIESKEISEGYFNPIIVANILKCRIKCLEEMIND